MYMCMSSELSLDLGSLR